MTTPAKWAQYEAGESRRQNFIHLIGKPGATIESVCAEVGVSKSAYWKWRSRYDRFASQVDAVRQDVHESPATARAVSAGTKYAGGFQTFRLEFFGHGSPWFHIEIIAALEASLPGEITLITIPPEHGKTTTLEDWVCMKLALDPQFRITMGSEKQQHTRKSIKRIKTRMEEGGSVEYRRQFGPFRAPRGDPRRASQPWAADHFDVYKRGGFDERDYNMVGLGMGSAIAGSRTDFLLVDDPQSRHSLNQTEEMVQVFRQDWLSRPGSKGRTVILMTRQGEKDFANALIEAGIIDHHIVLSAWTDVQGWLWPERYTEDEYGIMRRNVGEEAWELNYLQIARPLKSIVFDWLTIARGRNEMRTINDHVEPGTNVCLSIDPGYNVMGYAAAVLGMNQLQILDAHKEYNVKGTEGLIQHLEDGCQKYSRDGAQIEKVIIETKAWQRGLATDTRILNLQQTYGFRIVPHETGLNKYDPDLGVPQIVHSLIRGEIDWPWADDGVTRQMLGQLEADMYRWRPYKKGKDLEQDALMAVWFLFLHWKQYRRSGDADLSQFDFDGAASLWLPGVQGVA